MPITADGFPTTRGTQASPGTIWNVLKDRYADFWTFQLNRINILLSNITPRERMFDGREWVVPIHTGGNEEGVGTIAESVGLPSPGHQRWNQARFEPTFIYGVIELTGQALKSVQSQQGGWVQQRETEMRQMVEDVKRDCNRQVWADGSGRLTQCVNGATDETVLCNSVKHIRQNMVVCIANSSTGTVITDGEDQIVQSVDRSAKSFDVESGQVPIEQSTDAVYRGKQEGTTPANRNIELNGLEAIISDANPAKGNFGRIDRTTVEGWQSNVLDRTQAQSGSGDDFTDWIEFWMQEALDEADIESGESPGLIITTHLMRNHIARGLMLDRRYTNTVSFRGGFTGISYGDNIGIVVDRDAHFSAGTSKGASVPTGALTEFNGIYFVNLEDLELLQMSDGFEWSDLDGSTMKWKSGFDAYQAYLMKYFQLGASRCNSHALLYTPDPGTL